MKLKNYNFQQTSQSVYFLLKQLHSLTINLRLLKNRTSLMQAERLFKMSENRYKTQLVLVISVGKIVWHNYFLHRDQSLF